MRQARPRLMEPATTVPFTDLSFQWRAIESAAMPDIKALFGASAYSLGPWVEKFERDVGRYLNVEHAIAVNSGTSALHLAAIVAGLGPGDEVLVPANTFVASAWAVRYVGAVPVFCDVDPSSWTIDLSDAERRLTRATKAIIPVHLYGQPAGMRSVEAFARQHRLRIIEDAAQAMGAMSDGARVGYSGRLTCFSFYPGKNLGAAGEAGLITTSDGAQADRLRSLRDHAQHERYVHSELGFNYRMDGIQGLVLSHKLRELDAWTDERRRIAQDYFAGLADVPLELPAVVNGDHVWHLFVVHTPQRDGLRAHLAEMGVDTRLHYPVPLHRQPCFSDLSVYDAGLPVVERNSRECLSLPIYMGMTADQIGRVVAGIHSFFGQAAAAKRTSSPIG